MEVTPVTPWVPWARPIWVCIAPRGMTKNLKCKKITENANKPQKQKMPKIVCENAQKCVKAAGKREKK